MGKGNANQGVRTEESGVVDNSVPVTDATSGDEGIDDPQPKNKAEPDAVEDDPSATPPSAATKNRHDLP